MGTGHIPRTVAVARLLAEQGHVASAREILTEVLGRDPGDAEAIELAGILRARPDRPGTLEPPDEAIAPPEPGDPAALAAWFRDAFAPPARRSTTARLSDLLDRVRKNRHATVR